MHTYRLHLQAMDNTVQYLKFIDKVFKYTDDLWTAPELLRVAPGCRPANGTQEGDVYSFAIILQEILFRASPYFLDFTDTHGKSNTAETSDTDNKNVYLLINSSYGTLKIEVLYLFYQQTDHMTVYYTLYHKFSASNLLFLIFS